MKFDSVQSEIVSRIVQADTVNFAELCRLAGLDPVRSFRFSNLSGVDFSNCDLSGFDFTGANLTGANFRRAKYDKAIFKDAITTDAKWASAESGHSINRSGNTSAAAEFGAPTLVWHVVFWPRRKSDDFSVDMIKEGKIKEEDLFKGEARGDVTEDFNRFLESLQDRGRHPAAPKERKPFELRKSRDWDGHDEPSEVFESEATGFTLWWPDSLPDSPSVNVMSNRSASQPIRTDLRVRVQAETSVDYSTVTFFIDAGKPWNEPPIYLSSFIDGIGERRQTIFKHVRNIKIISEERLEAIDHNGTRLIDLEFLPEPNPICGTSAVDLEHGFIDCAAALKAAADYLYDEIWKDFCRDFGFNINSIAGEKDVVFASFRGLIMSTCGTEVIEHGKLVRAPEPKYLSEMSHPGSMPFLRFDGGWEDKVEPNAVVKAYMPFMRRFRPESDGRDWIACGIFDWRALYIDTVGAQTKFAAFDEWDYDCEQQLPSAIQAGHIPKRRANQELAWDGEDAPMSPMNNGPTAPARFLLLLKFEPDRRQAGRMVERINSLRTHRLLALRDWGVIKNADVWINHYRRQLDAAFEEWIGRTNELQTETARKISSLDGRFWSSIQSEIDALGNAEVENIRRRYWSNPRWAYPKLRRLAMINQGISSGPWNTLLKAVDDREEDYRTIESDNDFNLAEINRAAEHEFIKITESLDKLGGGAVGGLPYRISRSRYYGDTFRAGHLNLLVGPIEAWWSYDQFARRMEPVLKFIDNVGERFDKLQIRLQTMKQDILQRSIAIQTEATRDNTHRLERIQSELKRMSDLTEAMNQRLLEIKIAEAAQEIKTAEQAHLTAEIKKMAAEHQKTTAEQSRQIAQWNKWRHLADTMLHSIPNWITAIVGLVAAAYAAAHLYLFK
jgi:hypothetical protein